MEVRCWTKAKLFRVSLRGGRIVLEVSPLGMELRLGDFFEETVVGFAWAAILEGSMPFYRYRQELTTVSKGTPEQRAQVKAWEDYLYRKNHPHDYDDDPDRQW